jgi:2-oxoglutarate ferredoxin oxidoreductase subunit gamma
MSENTLTRLEVRFAGAGGQGLQSAATVLGKSLMQKKLYVCQSQNYGPESRGGISYSDLIISKTEIDFPKIRIPDVLVCMSNESYFKFRSLISNGSLKMLIIDPEMVVMSKKDRYSHNVQIYSISATRTSEEIFNSRIGSNVVLVGAVHSICRIGNPESIETTLSEEWPNLARENIAAFRRGIELAEKEMI